MNTSNNKTTDLVCLLSEAIDDLRNIGCDDLADNIEERMNNILGLSINND